MTSVLVLGATGAVGFDVSLAFLNHGFNVYGLARTQDKANFLLKNEIIPVVAKGSEVDVWGPIAEKVDVVVEAVMDTTDHTLSDIIFDKLKEVTEKRPHLTILYTSGSLVYGDSQEVKSENSPYNPNGLYAGAKIQYEKKYQSIGGIIIQPSFVFGRSGSASSIYFNMATSPVNSEITLFGKNDQYRSFIHSIDLAQIYLLAALKGKSVLGGQVFLASSEYFRTEHVLRTIAKAANIEIKAINFVAPPEDNFFGVLFSASSATLANKARNILGWKPTQPSLIDNIDRYYQAWNLSKKAAAYDQ